MQREKQQFPSEYALKGEWALDFTGVFRANPWFLVSGGRWVAAGFGSPPEGYLVRDSGVGVWLPGLVNAHTHLELSWLKGHFSGGRGIHDFALSFGQITPPGLLEQVNFALKEMENAYSRGTFYYADTANNPQFSREIAQNKLFCGPRFLEILGFAPPFDEKRIINAKRAMAEDPELLPIVHSLYGSSPKVLEFAAQNGGELASIHLFEEAAEWELPSEKGETYEFLQKISQYKRYQEIYRHDLLDYLQKSAYFNMFDAPLVPRKVLIAHLLNAGGVELERLYEKAPGAAVVLCERSNRFLGYQRQNWQELKNSPFPLLLGTDSAAMAGSLSVLDEIAAMNEVGAFSEKEIWQAATTSAYDYFNLKEIPWFFFEEAKPEVDSLRKSRCEMKGTITRSG